MSGHLSMVLGPIGPRTPLMQKISNKFPKRSWNGKNLKNSQNFGVGCADLSRTCPGPVPHLSRTCPAPVPDLSRTCPGPVPELFRPVPKNFSAEPTPLRAFYGQNVENTSFGGSSDFFGMIASVYGDAGGSMAIDGTWFWHFQMFAT